MFNTPPMVDMKLTAGEKAELSPEAYNPPMYPWGLSISLDKEQLDKLEVDFDSVEVGETYHLFIMAKVTAKSRNERESGGPCDRIEMQITHMGAESEDTENEEYEPLSKRMYGKR